MILHNYGPMNMIGSVHIQVPDSMNAKDIHKLTRTIEMDIFKEMGIILTIGIYASNTTDQLAMSIKKDLDKVVQKYPSIIQTHAFYVDEDKKEITFDMVISFDDKTPDETKQNVIKDLSDIYPDYKYNVIIDNDISD